MTPRIKHTVDSMIKSNVIPVEGLFDITEFMLSSYVELYGCIHNGELVRKREIEFARKLAGLNLLKLKLARGGSPTTCKEGLVYLITNPAWPDHLKVGMLPQLCAHSMKD
jgi:hypothetical protein